MKSTLLILYIAPLLLVTFPDQGATLPSEKIGKVHNATRKSENANGKQIDCYECDWNNCNECMHCYEPSTTYAPTAATCPPQVTCEAPCTCPTCPEPTTSWPATSMWPITQTWPPPETTTPYPSTTPCPTQRDNPKFSKILYQSSLPAWPIAGTTVHLGLNATTEDNSPLVYQLVTSLEFLTLSSTHDIIFTNTVSDGAYVGPNNVMILEVTATVSQDDSRSASAIIAIVFPRSTKSDIPEIQNTEA